jgi:uncharacterized protein YndB with AHSA1/START domain
MDFAASLHCGAAPDRVYEALTDPKQLEVWFAEHAEVSLAEGRYEFWGRYTPDGQPGRQRLLDAAPGQRLRLAWRLDGGERTVDIALAPSEGGTEVTVTEVDEAGHAVFSHATFWGLALANLASHVEGHSIGLRQEYPVTVTDTATVATVIDAPPAEVFASLLDPEQLGRWMLAENAQVEPHVGGRYDIGWDHGPMRILELVPDRVLAYSWQYPDSPDTVVRWELEGSAGRTHLTVVHSGFADPTLAEQYREGWPGFLVALKRLHELGPDRRQLAVRYEPGGRLWTV